MFVWAPIPQRHAAAGSVAFAAELLERTRGHADGVLVVGDTVGERDDLNWFERLPLFGKRVLVTRATDQASRLSRLLREYGAEPIELPAIRIVPPEDFSLLDAAVAQLDRYDWVIFTSVNGVDTFFDRVAVLDKDARAFGRSRIAAIGTATAERLAEHGLRADFVPERFVAEEVVSGLVERGIAGKHALLPRAELARDVLPDGLRAAGADVDVVVAYRTLPADPSPEAIRRVEAGEVDIVTFASSSTVRNLVSLLGGQIELLERSFIACIGPITARTARDLGLRVDLVAQEYSVPGLVGALVNAAKENRW
jgi:uroporphyrinogen-III synthase